MKLVASQSSFNAEDLI